MEPSEAQLVIALLQASYPNKPIPDSSLALYAQELLPYRFETAQAAVRNLARTSKFLPALSEILEEVMDEAERRAFEARLAHPPIAELEVDAQPVSPEQKAREREMVKQLLANYRKRSLQWSQPTPPPVVPTQSLEREPRNLPAPVPCDGVGKVVHINEEGERVCPDCGVPVTEMSI